MTQHHPTTPARLPHSPWPSPGPSLKDLPRRTRSPLRMAHQKPTALFSKKASALPLNLFSWSAAASLGMLAVFSFDAPAFGHNSEGLSFDFSLTGVSVTEGGHLCDHTPEDRLAVINQRRGIITRGDRDSNGNLILTQDRLLEPKHYCNDVITVSNQSLRLEDQDPSDVTRLTGSYTVVLGAQPGADVFVNVHTTNSDVSVSPKSLTFTRANWNRPQTVNVMSNIDITGRVISHSVKSDGSPYYRWLGNNVYSPLPLHVDITGYGEDDQTPEPTPEPTPDQTPDQKPEPTPDQTEELRKGLSEGSKEELRKRVEEINKKRDRDLLLAKIELANDVREIFQEPVLEAWKGFKKQGPPGAMKGFIKGGTKVLINHYLPKLFKISTYDHDGEKEFNRLAENLYIHHEALQTALSLWIKHFLDRPSPSPLIYLKPLLKIKNLPRAASMLCSVAVLTFHVSVTSSRM